MDKQLPARPNLEHLKGQAKSLLAQVRKGDTEALAEFSAHYSKPLAAGEASLANAQFVVARRYSYDSWVKLSAWVNQLMALDGIWRFEWMQVGGEVYPETNFSSSTLQLDGCRFITRSPEGDYVGEFMIDVEAMPHTIDIRFDSGPEEEGSQSLGIYKIEGGKLTICLGLVGASRPTDFVSASGTQHALEVLGRTDSVTEFERPEVSEETFEIDDSMLNDKWPALEVLQGTWQARSIVRDGVALPNHMLSGARRIADGAWTTVTFGPTVFMRAKTKFYETVVPNEIDYFVLEGAAKGKVQRGIFEFDGTTIKTCMAEPGADRPTAFESLSGSRWTLSSWRKPE